MHSRRGCALETRGHALKTGGCAFKSGCLLETEIICIWNRVQGVACLRQGDDIHSRLECALETGGTHSRQGDMHLKQGVAYSRQGASSQDRGMCTQDRDVHLKLTGGRALEMGILETGICTQDRGILIQD